MTEAYRAELSPEAQKAAESTWLKENIVAFWSTAYAGYYDGGRGAIVIDTTSTGLSEDTPFHYSRQDLVEEQADEISRQLAELVADYDPESQFVAVFIRPRATTHSEFSMFQMRLGEKLLQAIAAREGQSYSPEASGVTTAETPELEPPDLETLMAWEEEGGCEATDGCWVESDGVCSHGHQSWLLELGLI